MAKTNTSSRMKSAKSYIGKTVNICLDDGSTIPAVTLEHVDSINIFYKLPGKKSLKLVPLRSITQFEERTIFADF
jgi:hypothetical protein